MIMTKHFCTGQPMLLLTMIMTILWSDILNDFYKILVHTGIWNVMFHLDTFYLGTFKCQTECV